jgi:hypothetical protein
VSVDTVDELRRVIRAGHRVPPEQLPRLAKLIRERGRELGAMDVVRGSWADNPTVVTMTNAIRAEITLAGSAAPAKPAASADSSGLSGVALSVHKKLRAKGVPHGAAVKMAKRAAALHARKTGAKGPKASAA